VPRLEPERYYNSQGVRDFFRFYWPEGTVVMNGFGLELADKRLRFRARRSEMPAFTLIELLVVITVIAILASLFLPALHKAKQQAAMAKCISNLHQIGIGLKMYVDENRDTFPPAWGWQATEQFGDLSNPPAYPNYYHALALGGNDFTNGTLNLPPAKYRLLAPYVPAGEVFHFPADRGSPQAGYPSVFSNLGCSYRLTIYGAMITAELLKTKCTISA